jgi:hypothetical protein
VRNVDDIYAYDKYGDSFVACEFGQEEIVRILIGIGANAHINERAVPESIYNGQWS